MTSITTKEPSARKPRRMAREPKLQTAATQTSVATVGGAKHALTPFAGEAKPLTKSAVILGLLTRTEGATLDQLIEATGWLPHTTRAALSGLKKKGFEVASAKADGLRTYRVINKAESGKPDEPQTAEASDT